MVWPAKRLGIMLLVANYCGCMIQIYISVVDNDVDLSIFGQVGCEEIFNDLLAMLTKVPVGSGGILSRPIILECLILIEGRL